jgi:(1->4)-alpha-D-glucan 1-alpha-D-glucosylmutase
VEGAGENLVPLARQLLDSCPDGRIKLYLIHRTLRFRREHQELFSRGDYLPLQVRGEKSDHLCAFARTLDGRTMVVAVPRLVVGLTGSIEQPPLGAEVWKETWLDLPKEGEGGSQTRSYRNLFTGEVLSPRPGRATPSLPVAEALANFPVALLERLPDRG